MPEITRRRTGELLRGVFGILREAPEGLPAREVLSRLERVVPSTEFERSEYPNYPGVQRREKIVRFATVSCVKAGWLLKSRGRWTLTDEGRKVFDKIRDPEEFSREVSRLYRKWREGQETETVEVEEADPQQVSRYATFEGAENAAWQEIELHVSQMDPYDFQKLVGGLLEGMGLYVDWVSPPGPDGGFDIHALPDPLGTREPRVKVSVRRRVEKADVKDLREFLALLHGSDVGIFVSVSGFTKSAEDLARQEQRRIRLLDLDRVFDLWVGNYAKIPEQKRRLLPLQPVWFLAPGETP